MKKFKTEYRRCFKYFKFWPVSSDDLTGSQEGFAEIRKEIRPLDCFKLEFESGKKFEAPESTEKQEKFVAFPRAQLIKRSTNLHSEGEFMVKSSEMHSQFVKQEAKRTDITRRPTSLHLEGDMAVSSETSDQFVELKETRARPELIKAPANNLKLEGEMDVLTESNAKYVPLELPKRVPLTKQHTNLQLEGIMDIQSEQKDKYVPFNVQERAPLVKRQTNLQLEGEMDTQTEKREKYVPFELTNRPKIQKRPTNLQLDGEILNITEKAAQHTPFDVQTRPPLAKKDTNLQLRGDLIMTPEYRQEFIEKHVERVRPSLPANNIGLHIDDNNYGDRKKDNFFEHYQKPYRGNHDIKTHSKKTLNQKRTRTHAQATNLKNEELIEPVAEYKSSYVDFPRERPVLRKPEGNLRPEGHVSHLSEKSSAFVPHGVVTRPTLARREDTLKMNDEPLGDRFECQPEYRKAYNDYLQRENLARKPRKLVEEVDSENGNISKIPLLKGKRHGSKSPTPKPDSATSKSRSISPSDRRRRRPLPHTPLQQRVLVPDRSDFTPRRPSSIFGPKTGRWYPRSVSPEPEMARMRHGSDDEWNCGGCVKRKCSPCCECRRCRSRNASRWGSPSRLEDIPASFVVLTDKVEINNNRMPGSLENGRSVGTCCKEQKWMPPWYEPPM